jgi:tryptophan synthase beta subunit
LVDCLDEIEKAFIDAKNDPLFWKEFESYYPYCNRPSQLHLADRLTKEVGMKILTRWCQDLVKERRFKSYGIS